MTERNDIAKELRDSAPYDIEIELGLRAAVEIERLRSALTKIADPDVPWGHMKLIAREALGGAEQSAREEGK